MIRRRSRFALPGGARRRLIAVQLAACLLVSSHTRADEGFLLPSRCRQLTADDQMLGTRFKIASARYDAFNGAKGILDQTLVDSQRDLYWNSGSIADLRTAAFIIQKVSDATVHAIAGLTPEGAVMGTVEDAAGAFRAQVEVWVARVGQAKEKGEEIQSEISGDKPSFAGRLADFATNDEVVNAVQLLMKKVGLEHLAPIAHNIAELTKAGRALNDAINAGNLGPEQRAYELTARAQIAQLQANIDAYELSIRAELTNMSDLQTVHDQIEQELRSSCSTKPCDEAEQRAVDQRDDKLKDAQNLLGKAAEMRRRGPDFTDNYDALQQTAAQIAAVEQEATTKLSDLDQKIDDLRSEEAAALDELRRGLFCSKCRRTATEIEREEHVSFQEHLGTVHGDAVPASAEEVAERQAQYEDKIRDATNDYNQALASFHGRDRQLLASWADLIKERHKIDARWLGEIQRLEAEAKKIRNTAEAAYARAHGKVDLCRHA